MLKHTQIFVNGQWIDSTATDSIDVVNPVTEEVIATVPRGTAVDVDHAASAAADAFQEWSRSSIEERSHVLRKLADLIEERADDITRTIVSEIGQPLAQTGNAQTATPIADLRNYADSLRDIVWREPIRSSTSVVQRLPAGVVGAIGAWNGPLRSVVLKAGAAIAAGCTVVVKGSEVAPLTSFVLADLVTEAGLPPGVFNLVAGDGPEVGEAIASHPLVDMVSLTGSVRAGQRVMELASRSIKRVALELGGKSASVVLEDADLEHAITLGLEDAFRNSGQVCGSLSRVLVPKSRLREAEELAVAKAESYVLGDPYDPATTLGPVANANQRDRVRSHIQRGLDDGTRLLTGGPEKPELLERGFFVKPTLFTGDNQSRIARDEVFGPVVVFIPYSNEDEAISIANDSSYGLAGAVWAADPARARKVAGRIRTGRVRINGTPIDMRAPHGGFKLSGIGREMGRHGIEEFLEYQSVHG
ncbi:aldehyde dehydrogenase family protein [Arthrobacter sp. FW306-04-A]|uniref:aldehyde dehydrogenase family protein n=1 Tax=Arthrobacter sp. FW306-04-A TaxID=2879619 RepID=UPI0037C05ECD|nr:aldehyde dehydrogenase family protein [Arthrobacter sp. FW306-04-A]